MIIDVVSTGGEYAGVTAANRLTSAQTGPQDGYRAALELSMMLPENAAGTTLAFRTIQSCQFGENAWVQIADDGGDAELLDSPTPTMEVVADGEKTASGHGIATSTSPGQGDEPVDAATSWDQTPYVFTSLVVGVLGVLLAIVALLAGGRRAS